MRALSVEELGFVAGGFTGMSTPDRDDDYAVFSFFDTKPDWKTPPTKQPPTQPTRRPYRPSKEGQCLPGYTPRTETVSITESVETGAEVKTEVGVFASIGGAFNTLTGKTRTRSVTVHVCVPAPSQPSGGSFGFEL